MLPHFPEIQQRLLKLLNVRLKLVKDEELGPLSSGTSVVIFEGDKIELVREDGAKEVVRMKEAKAERRIDFTEVETLTPEIIHERIDSVAKEIARQEGEAAVEELEKAVRKTGNIIDTPPTLFSPDDYFRMLDMLDVEFDERGQPRMPQFLVGPEASENISKVLKQVASDPDNKKRLKEIIERKREEWRDREADRKLVG